MTDTKAHYDRIAAREAIAKPQVVSESMVERVMRSVISVVADRVPDDRLAIELTKLSGPIARAAIAAMREPTEGMSAVGVTEFYESRGLLVDTPDSAVWSIYTGMVDAALKEP
jgi:hypothetical protein